MRFTAWRTYAISSLVVLAGCGTKDKPRSQPEPDQNPSVEPAPLPPAAPAPNKGPHAPSPNKGSRDPAPVPPAPKSTPVALHGELSVASGHLVDSSGKAVQLRGVSSHGMQWFPQFMNYDAFKFMRDAWNLSVVRAAMYDEEGGYNQNPAVKEKVMATVDAAVAAGVYVIIDWHILSEGDPNQHVQEAKIFFAEMAAKYGKIPNVLYEICNEPNGSVQWDAVKRYAEEVIPVIRATAPNSIVIVGNPQWSQRPDAAASSPLAFNNVMYTLHFYSGTHKEDIRENLRRALKAGLAVFVTEWSTSEASGNGGPYEEEGDKWMAFLTENAISWTSWSLSDKGESSALLVPGANPKGPWTDSDLTATGRYVKAKMLQ